MKTLNIRRLFSSRSTKKKVVRIIRDWTWPNLMAQTPGHLGVWDDIQFTEEAVSDCDYVVILNNLAIELNVDCPFENIWRVVQEPPSGYLKEWHRNPSYCSKTFTCDPELSGPQYVSYQPMLPWHVNRDYDFLKSVSMPEKTRTLSWITSTKGFLVGHKRRLHFLQFAAREIEMLDLLGGGVYHISNTDAGRQNEEAQKTLGFAPIEDKWAGLAPYKFSLAIENAVVPDYWSEKIGDCFLSWTLPIYYGCPNLEDYFPRESFIRIDIERQDEAVEIIREALREDPWEQRLPAINEARNLVLERYQLFPLIAHLVSSTGGADLKR